MHIHWQGERPAFLKQEKFERRLGDQNEPEGLSVSVIESLMGELWAGLTPNRGILVDAR